MPIYTLTILFWALLCLGVAFCFRRFNVAHYHKDHLWCQCDSSGLIHAASATFMTFFDTTHTNHPSFWELLRPCLAEEHIKILQKKWQAPQNGVSYHLFSKAGQSYILVVTRQVSFSEKLSSFFFTSWVAAFALALRKGLARLLGLTLDHTLNAKKTSNSFLVYVLSAEEEPGTRKLEQKELIQNSPLLKRLPFLMWHLDTNLQVSYANTAYLEVQQYLSLREKPGADLFKGMAFQKLIEKAYETESLQRAVLERQILAETRIFDVFAFKDPHQGLWLAAHDITGYTASQHDLKKKEHSTEKLFKNLPLSVGIFGDDMHLRAYNSNFAGMFQLDDAWLSEKPLVDDILDVLRQKRMLPEMIDFAAYKHQFKSFFRTPAKTMHEELVHLPNERSLRIILASYPPAGCLMLCEDMTEKLHLKRKNNEMNIVLHATTHQSSEGVILLSDNQRITFINPTCFSLWQVRVDWNTLTGQKILDALNVIRPRLYRKAALTAMTNMLRQSLAMRLPQKGVILLNDGRILRAEYLPLSSGEHMLKFRDVTALWEAKEIKIESTRLFLVERYLFLARLRQIKQKIEPKSIPTDHVYESYGAPEVIHAQNAKWVSSQFLMDTLRDLQQILSEDKSILRDSFLLADVFDEALALFDDLMTEKGLYLQVLGTIDIRLVMNRTLYGQFLARALGYLFYEALPRSLITLSLRRKGAGVVLYFTSRVLGEERHDIEQPTFRSWSLNLHLLKRFATLSGCTLKVTSCHKKRLSFACVFSAQSLERPAADNTGQVLPFSATLSKRRHSA